MSRGLAQRAAFLAATLAVVAFLAGLALADSDPAAGLAVALVTGAAAGAAGYAAFRPAQRTVRDVVGAASRIAGGELGGGVRLGDGATGDLSASFNVMSRRIQQLFGEVNAEHARLEAVLNASTDGILALSTDTTVRFANTAAANLLSTAAGNALDRPLIESARDYELDGLVRRAARSGQAESAVITYGQQRLPVRAAALPISDGGAWSVLLMLTDLTEVNRVNAVRRDFVSNVGHELRTPLASIRALAETIESGNVDPGPETAEFAGRIRQQVDRLTLLTNELLELSRIESGAIALKPVAVDLAAVAAQAVDLLKTRADQGKVRVETAQTGPTVEADADSLLRVFSNLLDNAIKFSPEGGTVVVAFEADAGDAVTFSVSDEGPGIAPLDLPRVFERFYKTDSSRSQPGVGLGLAIVKHTVRAHGGSVQAANRAEGGSRFEVTLPRRFAGPRARPGAPNHA
ncbi:MAG: sensor histidine kinase [Dehalococcoidia bacterium]